MSGPRSLRAAFEACQPLRKPLFNQATSSTPRRCFTSRSHLFAEPSLSPSEMIPNPDLLQPPSPSSADQLTSIDVADSPTPPPSSSPASKSSLSPKPPPQTEQKPPLRLPRSVQASYLRPLRITPSHGLPVCSLQLRSFSVRNLEFMADFSMRAAYYLGLPAKGPSPLPKAIERWTLTKSNFVHKKSQENFERITRKRVIEIQDGEAEVVKIWLAYLRRYAFWGVGMKANVWEFEGLDVAKNMDDAYKDIETELHEKLSSFGWKASVADKRSVPEWLRNQDGRLPGRPLMELRRESQTLKQPHKTESVY